MIRVRLMLSYCRYRGLDIGCGGRRRKGGGVFQHHRKVDDRHEDRNTRTWVKRGGSGWKVCSRKAWSKSSPPTKSLGARPSRLRRRRMDRPARSNNCSSPTLRQPARTGKFGLTKADSENLSRRATCLHHSRELAGDATLRALKRNLDEREEITRRTRPAAIGPPGIGWAPTLPYEAPTMGPAAKAPYGHDIVSLGT